MRDAGKKGRKKKKKKESSAVSQRGTKGRRTSPGGRSYKAESCKRVHPLEPAARIKFNLPKLSLLSLREINKIHASESNRVLKLETARSLTRLFDIDSNRYALES